MAPSTYRYLFCYLRKCRRDGLHTLAWAAKVWRKCLLRYEYGITFPLTIRLRVRRTRSTTDANFQHYYLTRNCLWVPKSESILSTRRWKSGIGPQFLSVTKIGKKKCDNGEEIETITHQRKHTIKVIALNALESSCLPNSLTLWGMLEAAVDDGPEDLRLEEEVPESGAVDGDVRPLHGVLLAFSLGWNSRMSALSCWICCSSLFQ